MTITFERLAELRMVAENFPRGQNQSESEANYNYELFLDTFSPSTAIDLLDLIAEKDAEIEHGLALRGHVVLDRNALRDRVAAVEAAVEQIQRLEAIWRPTALSHEPGLRTHDLDYANGVKAAYTILRAALAEGGGER